MFSLQRGIEYIGCIWIKTFPPWPAELNGNEPAILTDNLPQWQIELAPPLYIGGIAKGANHENASSLFDAGALIGKYRHRNAEQRRDGAFAKERLVPLIPRM